MTRGRSFSGDGGSGAGGGRAGGRGGDRVGGIVHTYQRYDPAALPSPTKPPPDMASAAFEHMLHFGDLDELTPEQLANAVEIDPSEIAGLGPSLGSLIAMLEKRKRRILETYETEGARREAERRYAEEAGRVHVPEHLRELFEEAVRDEQLRDLERLWYAAEDERSAFARGLMRLSSRLGDKYGVDELRARYAFTGRTPMTVEKALEVLEELKEIDRLLEQLREAMKNARVGLIDLEALSRFADEGEIDNLRALREQVEDYLRSLAESQGLERGEGGYRLTPKAQRLFQNKLLSEIFSSLQAARSGRHAGPIAGEGVVELPSTRQYEFGDSVAHMDIPQSFINALVRTGGDDAAAPEKGPRRVRLGTGDIAIHNTRNNPKCASCLLMDMSGSMRYGGQYVAAKRMALGLDGLIRREYPGDHLSFVEVYSVARVCRRSEVAKLMPKPVTIHRPVVRLKADMSRPDMHEELLPRHFTNIQHGLSLARRLLGAQDTPNRQVILITDGLPTAHYDGSVLYLLYPPDPATEDATMREALACRREGITINIFLVPSWSQSEEDVRFAHRVAESTGGRVFFTAGSDLDRFVLWDYVSNRRRIIS